MPREKENFPGTTFLAVSLIVYPIESNREIQRLNNLPFNIFPGNVKVRWEIDFEKGRCPAASRESSDRVMTVFDGKKFRRSPGILGLGLQ